MPQVDTKVVIVGGGAAGITAAIGLARRGIPVVVIEGGVYPGAENWSGAVYFTENLVRPEILGEDGLAQTPIERRIVQRGLLVSDGHVAVGGSVRSEGAFTHCHTVLRPVFDHDLAQKARLYGAEILTGTTATALIRDTHHVRGVLTDRGPVHADVVFLAEGDASNLVGREGLETKTPGDDGLARPEFLQGIKEVLELPAGEIERRFGVGEGEGAAFEILLRNGTVDGIEVPLNAGAFLYTNRESLSLGLVAPLENLNQVGVPHNRLMEWLKTMPALQDLLADARPVSFGAKLIRGGGWKEMPRLAIDGCAVGGAASGIGVDFPCPNYTGPATYMGWAFSEAVARIVEENEDFSGAALEAHYVKRVQESSYLEDVHALKDWPAFVSESREFFGAQVDAITAAADAATTRGGGTLPAIRAAFSAMGEKRGALVAESRRAGAALGLWRGVSKDLLPAVFWWTVNVVIGWFPRRSGTRAEFIPHFWAAGGDRQAAPPSFRYCRWVLAPGVAEALHHLYRNDGTRLPDKLRDVRRALLFRLSWLHLIGVPVAYVFARLVAAFGSKPDQRPAPALDRVEEVVEHDTKLAWINYRGDEHTHIHFHAAYDEHGLPDDGGSPLFNVCPANVYKAERDRAGNVAVAVLHENCIRCETCWRADDRHVDWGRTRGQRLVFETYTPADAWLRESREAAGLADADRRYPTEAAADADEVTDGAEEPVAGAAEAPSREPVELDAEARAAAEAGLIRVARHARSFKELMRHLPSVLSGADQSLLDALGLEVMAGAQAVATAVARQGDDELASRARAIIGWARIASPHLQARRFFHFEADVELLLVHHLPHLEELTGLRLPRRAEDPDAAGGARRMALRAFLAQRLDRETIEECESDFGPNDVARQTLLELVAALRDPETGAPVLPGSSARDAAHEELARLSPSLAMVLAGHLAACDLVFRPGIAADPQGALTEVREDLSSGRALAGILRGSFWLDEDNAISGQSSATLLGGVSVLLMPTGEGFCLLVPGDREVDARIFGGVGLRGAGPGRVVLDRARPRAFFTGEAGGNWLRLRASWDLVAVARGMIGYLAERALDHADSRVQFPGLFQGFRGRDAIAKFGAVQEMIAGIIEAREVVEGLRGRKGSGRFAAALAVDLLGPSPRSVSYLAGQVLGGTAFSEEDPVSRMFRDASMLTRVPIHVAEAWTEMGERALATLQPGKAYLPDLDFELRGVRPGRSASALVSEPYGDLVASIEEVTAALDAASDDGRSAMTRDLGRLCLLVAAVRALADRVETRLAVGDRDGVAAEAFAGLCGRVASRARRLADRTGDADAVCSLGTLVLDGASDGPCGATGALYADHLEDGSTFQSSDLIAKAGGGAKLALTPELIEADPYLWTLRQKTESIWRERYRERDFDGLPYTRLVEHLHHVPLADIRSLLDEGYFRMIIPEEYGGQGLKKAAYYIAMVEMMRHGDPTQAIIVMGSTSIGTTPILIGLQQDLPELERTLQALTDAKDVLDELASGEMGRADEVGRPLKSKAIRGLLPPDLSGWEEIVRAEQESLESRREAHGFYLRLISNGAISAFALTEPSAGSDTARIRTRSELVEVPVERDERGFWTFRPDGAPEGTRRTLFTRDSFEFGDEGMQFVHADRNRIPVQIRDFDQDADARSAAAGKYRFVELDGERVDIDDIGRVEERGGKSVYRYYKTSGAKMWITNGSTAGVMVLYARTSRGPSGFMLDAHAEGLVIGKDEEKMGQRGSATNELALEDVRIPVDQLIGIEGRGQENALETLNVGRAGLAVCCAGLMQEVVTDLRRAFAEREEPPTRAELLELGRIAIDVAAAEALAWQLVGRFDHPGTESVRMESALAKAANTEAYHRVLTRAERLLDAGFALDLEEMEKRRRDARVLTIYEGTSEIQRFLLLRDLMGGLDPEAVADAPPADGWKAFGASRKALLAAAAGVREAFGPRAAGEAWLQPVMFPLVESLMRVGAVSALRRRVEIAAELLGEASEEGVRRLAYLEAAADLLDRDVVRQDRSILARHAAAMDRLGAGRDTQARTLTDRALMQAESRSEVAPARPPSSIEGAPLRVAVIIDPRPIVAPRPRVRGGVLREHCAELGDADRGVLREVLRLREAGPVDVTVVGSGRIATVDVLEETIALGADRAFLVNTGTRNLLANDVAGAIADLLSAREGLEEAPFDLVVGPVDRTALMLPLARRLSLPPIERVSAFGVQKSDAELALDVRRGEASPLQVRGAHVLIIDAASTAAEFTWTSDGWRRARRQPVPVIDFIPEEAREIALTAASTGEGGASSDVAAGPLTVDEAARRFADEVGLGVSTEAGGSFQGTIDQVTAASFLEGLGALAVTEADADGGCPSGIAASVRAAACVASARKAPLGLLVIVASQDEEIVRRAAGEARAAAPEARIGLLAWEELASRSVLTRAWLLEGLLRGGELPAFFSPEVRPAALLAGEGRTEAGGEVVLVDGVDEVAVRDTSCSLSGLRFDRKIRFTVDGNGAVPHAIVTADVQAPPPNADRARSDERVVWLDEVPVPDAEDTLAHAVASAERALGVSLTDAEFIIDVGYGVGSRDGIEEVVEPLKAALEELGVKGVTVGATRKVTQDLGILPDSCQIGQTGVSVNPRVMLAVGVSGAPQHLEYIGGRAVIFAFNKDPDAPLMVLNRTRSRPLVFPIVGDLFQEVPRFVRALKARAGSRGSSVEA